MSDLLSQSTDRCRRLTAEDLHAMARVHEAAYGDRLLTCLGRDLLARYYLAHMEGRHGVGVIGTECDGELTGFCVLVRFTDWKPFLLKNLSRLLVAVLARPSLMLRAGIGRRLKGVLRSLFGSGTGATEEPGTVRILSIAVHPAFQHTGRGQQLLHGAALAAVAAGARKLALTVHRDNRRAIRAYERDGWTRITKDGVWTGAMEKTLVA